MQDCPGRGDREKPPFPMSDNPSFCRLARRERRAFSRVVCTRCLLPLGARNCWAVCTPASALSGHWGNTERKKIFAETVKPWNIRWIADSRARSTRIGLDSVRYPPPLVRFAPARSPAPLRCSASVLPGGGGVESSSFRDLVAPQPRLKQRFSRSR